MHFRWVPGFHFVLFNWTDEVMIDANILAFGFETCHHSLQLIQARPRSNPRPRQRARSPGPKPAIVTTEQVWICCKLLPTVANCCQLFETASENPSQNLLCLCLWLYASMPSCLPFIFVALTIMKPCNVFYSDSILGLKHLWLMLVLTLFNPTALDWAATTSAVLGVNWNSTCRKKTTLKIVCTQNLTVLLAPRCIWMHFKKVPVFHFVLFNSTNTITNKLWLMVTY